MPKYAIYNTICSDGVGDFTHFEDIIKALRANPRFKTVEFIAVVTNRNELAYFDILEKLKSLSITYFYGRNAYGFDDYITNSDKTRETLLSDVDQTICISYGDNHRSWHPYLKQDAPLKFIGEHESIGYAGTTNRSLGLSPGCFGIKIQPHIPMSQNSAWETIVEHDSTFATQLLTHTDSADFDMFQKKYVLIPAYFNEKDVFADFLNLLGLNHSFTEGRNIVIYQSGFKFFYKGEGDYEVTDPNASLLSRLPDLAHLKNLHIRRIELFCNDYEPRFLDINPDDPNALIIKIFSGLKVSNPSYDALYQLSNMAGVSGDNSFERCVAMDILPLYRSTNHRSGKNRTLRALQKITQLAELDISPDARESYRVFFDPDFMDINHSIVIKQIDTVHRATKHHDNAVDFKEMIEEWPIVCAYLRKNYNFYANLEHIVLEKLPNEHHSWLTFASFALVSTMNDAWVRYGYFNRFFGFDDSYNAAASLIIGAGYSLLKSITLMLPTPVRNLAPSSWGMSRFNLFHNGLSDKSDACELSYESDERFAIKRYELQRQS